MARLTVKLDATPVNMDGSEYWMFNDPDYPDILVTASNPESLAEWLAHVIVEALPNLNIDGFAILHAKRGARSLPRMSKDSKGSKKAHFDDDEDGDKGA